MYDNNNFPTYIGTVLPRRPGGLVSLLGERTFPPPRGLIHRDWAGTWLLFLLWMLKLRVWYTDRVIRVALTSNV